MRELLFLLLVPAPIVMGLLAWAAPWRAARNAIVCAAGAMTAGAGIMMALQPDGAIQSFPFSGSVGLALELLVVAVIFAIAWRIRSYLIMLMGLAQLGMIIAEVAMTANGVHILHHEEFMLDSLTKVLILITSLVGPLIGVYAIGYMDEHVKHAPPTSASLGRFFFIVVGFLGVMNGLVMSNSLTWLSVFWEITALCSYFLISHDGGDSLKNAERALLINTFGGLALVGAGFALFYFDGMESLEGVIEAKAVIPMVLLCIAAFTKSALLPFQSWLLGAMVAPTPVSALLHSATMVKAGSYLVLRLAPGFYGERVMTAVMMIGALTFAGAALLAITQNNAKRVLAYSTISNLGLVVACAGINSPLAYASALAIICFHAVSKGLLFLCVGTIEQRIGSRDIEEMSGMLFKMPFTTIVALIGMISMLLPPFGMLLSKWMAIEATIRSPLMLAFVVSGSALTVFFWSKWIGRIQTTSYHPEFKRETLCFPVRFALAALAVGVLASGVFSIRMLGAFFAPIARDAYAGVAAIPAAGWRNLAEVCSFPATSFFIALGLAFVVYWLTTWTRFRREYVRLPYLCGENAEYSVFDTTDEVPSYAFRGKEDKIDQAWSGTTYLRGVVSEHGSTIWLNALGWIIILMLLGEIELI